jgi:hypothetical protein
MSEEKLSPYQEWKKNLGKTRPWDMINPSTEFAKDELHDKRYSICQVCPEFISLTSQCKKCGCLMKMKTKLQQATCPIGKW